MPRFADQVARSAADQMDRQMQMSCRCTQAFGGLCGFALVNGSDKPGLRVPAIPAVVAFAQIAAQGGRAITTLAVRKVGSDRIRGFVGRREALRQMRSHEAQDVSDAARLHMWSNIHERQGSEHSRLQFAFGNQACARQVRRRPAPASPAVARLSRASPMRNRRMCRRRMATTRSRHALACRWQSPGASPAFISATAVRPHAARVWPPPWPAGPASRDRPRRPRSLA